MCISIKSNAAGQMNQEISTVTFNSDIFDMALKSRQNWNQLCDGDRNKEESFNSIDIIELISRAKRMI